MIRQPTIAVAALVVGEGKVLISERRSGKLQGTYGAPGGYLEWMETFEHAAIRELREETGLLADEKDCRVIRVGWENTMGEPENIERRRGDWCQSPTGRR